MKSSFFNSRKFRQGSVATVITVLVIALIVVFNMVVTAATNRFNLSIDLTSNQIFTLSDDTKEFIDALTKPVTISILNSEESFGYYQVEEMIKNYVRQSDMISVRYVDIDKDPTFVSAYEDLQLALNQVLVESGDNATTISPSTLYNVTQNYDGSYTYSSQAEQALTSAILQVASDTITNMVFIEGHGEESLDAMKSLFEMNNYQISTLNLLTEEIDPETDVAVIAAPTRDYTEDELRKLDKFLDNGGRLGKTLFYAASTQQPETPVLNAFLNDWGVSVDSGVVFEGDFTQMLTIGGMPSYYAAILDYAESEYSAQMQSRGLYPGTYYARPIATVFPQTEYGYSKGARTVEILQQFSELSGVRPADAASDWMPSQNDVSGPLAALTLTYEIAYDNLTPMYSYVLVAGSTQAVDSLFLSSSSFANSEYILSLMGRLAGREESVYIQDKVLSANSLGLTSYSQANTLFIALVVILPLAVLVFGMIIWLRRRHR